MKKIAYFTLIIALVSLSFGCSYIKEKEQKEEETVVREDENSEKVEFDPWPSNEFTDQVPKFTYGIDEKIYSNTEEGFIYGADDVTYDEYKLYKKELKKAGFKYDIDEIVDTITTYTATKDNYEVALSYVDDSITITIIKENLQE
ncbi:MAG TPA: hypothetical protein PLX66_01030 [Bacilli bacterium]|nr:hypothetical protein [Bacilli bacterium]